MKRFLALLAVLMFSVSACVTTPTPKIIDYVAIHKSQTVVIRALTEAEIIRVHSELSTLIDGGTKHVTLVINSPGGLVEETQKMISDLAQDADHMGTEITCVAHDIAGSMAAVLLQSELCDIRLMTPEARIMFHSVALKNLYWGIYGVNQSLAETLVEITKAANKRIAEQVTPRMKISEGFYLDMIKNGDWILSYKDALRYGAVDGIIEKSRVPKHTFPVAEPTFE